MPVLPLQIWIIKKNIVAGWRISFKERYVVIYFQNRLSYGGAVVVAALCSKDPTLDNLKMTETGIVQGLRH